jgi:hypothetical protein
MIDYFSISALIVATISAVASLHIYRVKICGDCIESDCWKNIKKSTSSSSLEETQPIINK